MNFDNNFGETMPTPRKPRARKSSASSKPNSKAKAKKINISNNDPIYCRQPISFGGKTLFTRHEVSEQVPPEASSALPNAEQRQKKIIVTRKPLDTTDDWQRFATVPTIIQKLRSDILCWYCCCPFTTCPVSLPISKKNNGKYLCHGVFCSWECCKTYNLMSATPLKHRRMDFLNDLVRKAYKRFSVHIASAPNRRHLKQFGGTLDIEQFREGMLTMSEEQQNIVYPEMDYTTKTPCNEIM